MNKLILACALSLAALTSGTLPVHAQSFTITTDDGPRYYRDEYRPIHRGWDRGWHRGWDRPRYHRVRCETRTVERHRHGRIVFRDIRVCR